MRARFATLLIVGLICAGCAKFPDTASNRNFTRLHFDFDLAGPINPAYIYLVAIRVLTPPVGTDPQLADEQFGPVQVVNIGSKNGVVEGLPTHYVRYDESSPELYRVFRFPTKVEAPDPSDTAPLNLAFPGILIGDVLPGTGVNPRPTPGTIEYGTQLGFDIDTRYLAANDADARAIQVIQFNIIATNRAALGSSSDREIDAIGDQSNVATGTFRSPFRINVTTGSQFDSQVNTSVPEPTSSDIYPPGTLPSVDIRRWAVRVTPP